jgi:hypothetical protein
VYEDELKLVKGIHYTVISIGIPIFLSKFNKNLLEIFIIQLLPKLSTPKEL